MTMQDSRVLPLAPLRHRYFSEERTLGHSVFTLALVSLHPRWTHAPYGCTLASPKVRCQQRGNPPAGSPFLTFPDSHSSVVFCLCGYSSPILTRSPLGATAALALQLQESSSPCPARPLLAPRFLSPSSVCVQGSYSPTSWDCRTTGRSWCDGCGSGAGMWVILPYGFDEGCRTLPGSLSTLIPVSDQSCVPRAMQLVLCPLLLPSLLPCPQRLWHSSRRPSYHLVWRLLVLLYQRHCRLYPPPATLHLSFPLGLCTPHSLPG